MQAMHANANKIKNTSWSIPCDYIEQKIQNGL